MSAKMAFKIQDSRCPGLWSLGSLFCSLSASLGMHISSATYRYQLFWPQKWLHGGNLLVQRTTPGQSKRQRFWCSAQGLSGHAQSFFRLNGWMIRAGIFGLLWQCQDFDNACNWNLALPSPYSWMEITFRRASFSTETPPLAVIICGLWL